MRCFYRIFLRIFGFFPRIKLAIKEAEIQKLQANLTTKQLSHSLNAYHDNKESGKLNGLETEPVKLGDGQVGEYIILNSLLINYDQIKILLVNCNGFFFFKRNGLSTGFCYQTH